MAKLEIRDDYAIACFREYRSENEQFRKFVLSCSREAQE